MPDSASTSRTELVVAVLAQVRWHSAARIEPVREAAVADAGHNSRHQAPVGRSQRDSSSRDRGFIAYRAQGLLARTIVRQIGPVLLQDGAVDLRESPARVSHDAGDRPCNGRLEADVSSHSR